MSKNKIILTAVCDNEGRLIHKDMRLTIDHLVKSGFQTYSVFWRNIESGLVAKKVYDANNDIVLENVNLNEISNLFHLFELGKIHSDLNKLESLVKEFKNSYEGIMINNPDTILNNMNKDYLLRLQDKGVLIPGTYKISTSKSLDEIKNEFKTEEDFVIKPWNGETGNYVMKLSEFDEKALTEVRKLTPYVLVQKYVPEIKEGEKSLIFFGDKFSHAVLKTPPDNSFLANMCRRSNVVSYNPTQKELELGFNISKIWDSPTNIYRLDLVSVKNNPVIIEVEMVNPGFFSEESGKFNTYTKNLGQFYAKKLENKL